MPLKNRIRAFAELGRFFRQFKEEEISVSGLSSNQKQFFDLLREKLEIAKHHNGWFTEDNVLHTFAQWGKILTEKNLGQWLSNYHFHPTPPKTIGAIMAGNIPLVGFHDFLSVLLSGNKILAKYSSKDKLFWPVITDFLIAENPEFEELIEFTDGKLTGFDAVIATGSNNTARYFEHYFSKKPNIIRKNRTSVAVLDGSETKEELESVGEDIFRYFGLGCRNISKIYLPEDYDFKPFFEAIYSWHPIINHAKYANNYDYNKAVYLMSDFKIRDNGFLILKEDSGFHSPIAALFYEYYSDLESLQKKLTKTEESDEIPLFQCIVSNSEKINDAVPLGKSQNPRLDDYADGVDTLGFLTSLR